MVIMYPIISFDVGIFLIAVMRIFFVDIWNSKNAVRLKAISKNPTAQLFAKDWGERLWPQSVTRVSVSGSKPSRTILGALAILSY